MKRIITAFCTAALLAAGMSGCVVVPVHPYHYYRY
jgi:hypothetical protein